MTDAQFKAQRRRLKALIKRWHHRLGLAWWRVHYVYHRDSSEFASSDDGLVHNAAAATTLADWRYLEATISFNMQELAELDDEALEFVFVHELMHVLVAEMRADHEGKRRHEHVDHEERVCTTLARAFITTAG